MCIDKIVLLLRWLICVIGSDVVANSISFFSLIIAIIALCIGGKKVNEILNEYRQKQRSAIFGYHSNLKVFIMRLKRLISDAQGNPIGTLYLFSAEDILQKKGNGYEHMAEKLSDLSQNFLDYLSFESNQIPASMNRTGDEEWDESIEKLVEYLTDFLLYDTKSYISTLDSEDAVNKYHKSLVKTLDKLVSLIGHTKETFRNELNE